MSEDNGSDHDGEEGSPPAGSGEQPPPTAEDVAVSQAKRAAAVDRIRAIREAGQERIAARFRAHLDDHGEEQETSAEDFLKETSGNQPPDD